MICPKIILRMIVGFHPFFHIHTEAERNSLSICDEYFLRVPESDRAYALWLVSQPWIGAGPIPKLLEYYGSPKEVYRAASTVKNREKENCLIPETLIRYKKENDIFRDYDLLMKSDMKISFIFDKDYPLRLKNIPDPPYALFYYGYLPENNKLSVAVIGARQCSEYGRRVATELGKILGKNDINVISGMATGIDGISQKATLNAGGRSFGILGSGADICYPDSNADLYESLKINGGVISTYPPGTPAVSRYFPPRNRIVSGLADAIVVIEARSRSGTMITVDMALEQGRDIYAAPGRLGDELSAGCNGLIGHGARIYLSPEIFMKDLFEEHSGVLTISDEDISFYARNTIPEYNSPSDLRHREYAGNREKEPDIDKNCLEIYRHLSLFPKSAEDIDIEITTEGGESQGETGICLMLMELCLEGYALQISPGYFIKK